MKDLKQRGLLDETLVIWGGEFGRTPMVRNQPRLGRKLGRDHHPQGFHDVDGRRRHEAGLRSRRAPTNGLSRRSTSRCTSTTCRPRSCMLLGLDHERLTFRFQGRDFRLTDVHGAVVKDLLA